MTEPAYARVSRFAIGVLLAGVFLFCYFLVATSIGFKGPSDAWEDYGEPPVDGPVRQPLSFWTDLAFVVAGLAALRRIDRAEAAKLVAANPMQGPSAYSFAFGLLIVWMGPASMLEHGTLTSTWGWFDASSIHWFGFYVSAYLILRAIPGAAESRAGFAAFWLVVLSGLGAIGLHTWSGSGARRAVSMAMLAVMGTSTVSAVVLGRFVGLRFTRQAWGWLAALAATFFLGVAFLVLGAKGGPAAPWGHGAWHLCCGAATYCTFRLLECEEARTPAPGSAPA